MLVYLGHFAFLSIQSGHLSETQHILTTWTITRALPKATPSGNDWHLS